MKPRSKVVPSGEYFLTWFSDGTIHTEKITYTEPERSEVLAVCPNWLFCSTQGYFEGTCMEDTVFYATDDLMDALRYASRAITESRVVPIVQNQNTGMKDYGFFRSNHNEISFTVGKVEKKCECGAESIGYNNHSTWCAKHE